MAIRFFIEGLIIGIVVAVPVGPMGLLCVNRALSGGPTYGLFSGLGVATADALAAGIAILGLTLVSTFLIDQQTWLRLIGGGFLFYLGVKVFRTRPVTQASLADRNGLIGAYMSTFLLTFTNPLTIVSFVAIYAGWGIQSLQGNYFSAGFLTVGVFAGSAFWWVLLSGSIAAFREKFSRSGLRWIHKISGTIIAGFGLAILLTLLLSSLGLSFRR